jgi:hypothetical protein
MSDLEQIKKMISKTRTLLGGDILKEDVSKIRKSHNLILEQEDETEMTNPIKKINPMKDIKKSAEYETADSEDKETRKSERKKSYRISGGILVLHGDSEVDVQLTTDDKKAFQESMDEFVSEVAEIVDFNKLNVYKNNVEWSGKVTEMDIEFFFSIGETKGVYINGTMIKLDDEFLEFVGKLQTYYEKFKSKWSKVIASKKKTPEK